MLLSLKNEYIFSLTIPSKLQSYMAFGKPVVSMLSGIGSDVVKDADCGYVACAGDYQSLAKNVILSYNLSADLLAKRGENAKKYYNQRFAKDKIVNDLLKIFQD
jgi:glycosyltransferase involved in cell wall biosynthesis